MVIDWTHKYKEVTYMESSEAMTEAPRWLLNKTAASPKNPPGATDEMTTSV